MFQSCLSLSYQFTQIKSEIMGRIFNSTNYTFSPSAQQAIRNAMANAAIDEVEAKTNRTHDEVDNIFNFFDMSGNYVFSIDVEGDVIFENQHIASTQNKPRREKIARAFNVRYSKDSVESVERFYAETENPDKLGAQAEALQEFLNSRPVDWAQID